MCNTVKCSTLIGMLLSVQALGLVSVAAQAAQLIYENTFDNGKFDSVTGGLAFMAMPQTPVGCEKEKWKVVADPSGLPGRSLRILQQGGQECLALSNKHRALVGPTAADSGRIKFRRGVEYWVGYKIYIPDDFETRWLKQTGSRIIHFQVNRYSPHGETPAVDLVSSDGQTVELEFSRRFVSPATGRHFDADRVKVPLVRGSWNTVIMNFKLMPNDSGFLKVWVNGLKRMDVTGQTDTVDSVKPSDRSNNTNMGMYWGTENRPFDWTIYLDEWRIATGGNGFDLVNPENAGNAESSGVGAVEPPPAPKEVKIIVN